MTDPIRILLADDHPLFRDGVAHSLEAEPDFQIIGQVDSGEEAIALARDARPDIVLLDISMPGCGGIAAAETIANELPATRIIMLTAAENRDALMNALKAGAHGYVLKGVSAAVLRDIVRRVIGGEAYITPVLASSLLIEFSRPAPSHDPITDLAPREADILELLKEGLTNREIGERIHLSEKTVKHYMTNILQKLQVRSRTEAVLVATRQTTAGKTGR